MSPSHVTSGQPVLGFDAESQSIAAYLINEGELSKEDAINAQADAVKADKSLMRLLAEQGGVTTRALAQAASHIYSLPFVDLDTLALDALPSVEQYPVKLLQTLEALPIAHEQQTLSLAIAFPDTLGNIDELEFAMDVSVTCCFAPGDQLATTLEIYLQGHTPRMADELDAALPTASSLSPEQAQIAHIAGSAERLDAPVVKFIDTILREAYQRGASDVHFEPYETYYQVRLRIDGVLSSFSTPPLSYHQRIAARLKVMAALDVSERRLPQDGALSFWITSHKAIDFRLSTLPTNFGEKLVLRLLDPAAAQRHIDELGFSSSQQQSYQAHLSAPQGMLLVTGPTGSGKTVTLYTGLAMLNQMERNICTAEDPVEIKLAGVNQLNIMPSIGLGFSEALRAFLRQDPDVVMVGEIRDLETADIAIKAAQTGHLVLSTLHTNSAAQTLTRLSNIGIASYNIASSVNLIIAQRLARKLCEHCKVPADIPLATRLSAGFAESTAKRAVIYRPVGCKHCSLGYRGRIGIYEVLPISDTLRQMIAADASATAIEEQARREGHSSLRKSGLWRVADGTTSLDEINRLCME